MGTEIFPQIAQIIKIILVVLGVVSFLTIIAATIEYYVHRGGTNEKRIEEMKSHIISGLIVILIAMVVYLMLSIVGPLFQIFF